MASAATVGSNHNSRSSDGEIVADRGFWPGLSVSLKHNSRFAAFCLIAKGSYPAELDVPLPFTLISNNENEGELVLMPGYWFRYNMYALARNAAKTGARDKRLVKHQNLEFDWLAPDTVDQMRKARKILEAWADESPEVIGGSFRSGREWLEAEKNTDLYAGKSFQVESGRRKVKIVHARRAWKDFGRMIRFYAVRTIIEISGRDALESVLKRKNPKLKSDSWVNIGGQLMTGSDLEALKDEIRSGVISDWPSVHNAYKEIGGSYHERKISHAETVLAEIMENETTLSPDPEGVLEEALETAAFILDGIKASRRKDYENPFRNITYENDAERDAVVGSYEDNDFIKDAENRFKELQLLLSVEN